MPKPVFPQLVAIPASTYRLQFNGQFRLSDAQRLAEYLSELGVTDVYASPLFRAREHSSHGYDVVDYDCIDPAIGSEADFESFSDALRRCGLGLVMDVVPNHMGIDDWHNVWWQDVLENGPGSRYASFFDIDWSPPKLTLKDRILLPFLGDQFGKVLENKEIKLVFDDGRFHVAYYERRFPIDPVTSPAILRLVLEDLQRDLPVEDPHRMELESIMTAMANLPPRSHREHAQMELRHREQLVIQRRLAGLSTSSAPVGRGLSTGER